MPIEKLTRKQLEEHAYSRAGGYEPYTAFLQSLRAGEGGTVAVAEEGVTKQTIKNRLNTSADAAGVEISFRRTGKEKVVFEVTGRKR